VTSLRSNPQGVKLLFITLKKSTDQKTNAETAWRFYLLTKKEGTPLFLSVKSLNNDVKSRKMSSWKKQ